MKSDINDFGLPSLTADLLNQQNLNIDNTFSTTWKNIGFKDLLKRAKFNKRSGTSADSVVFYISMLGYFYW
jgi:hypothetical protein